MQLKNFSLLHEGKDHYVVGHPSGRSLTVPKQGLSQAAHMQIKKMSRVGEVKNYDNGGGVNSSSINDTEDQATPVTTSDDVPITQRIGAGIRSALSGLGGEGSPIDVINSGISSFSKGLFNGEQDPNSQTQTPAQTLDNYNPNQDRSAASAGTDAQTTQSVPGIDVLGQLQKGISQQSQGLEQQAQGQQQQAGMQSAAQEYKQAQLGDLMHDYQAQHDSLMNERQGFLQDYKNGHIDPNKFMEDKSTMGKISTAIGLILGGIGGGLTHQENPALKFLQSQIERNIEAQKANIGKYPSLLEANAHALGNLDAATNMTRANLNDVVSSMVDDAAAKSADPQIKGRALQLTGLLNTTTAGQLQSAATNQAIMKQMGSLSGGKQSPDALLNMLDVQNPELAKNLRSRLVPNHGFASTSVDQKTKDAMTKYDELDNQLADAIHFAQNTGTTVPLSINSAIANEKRNNIILSMNDLHGLNRLNDREFETYQNQVPDPGEIRTQKAVAQLSEIRNAISQRKAAELKSLGLPSKQINATPRPMR